MTKQNEVYKCALCGNIVEVLHAGAGELVCCGQAMSLMTENTVDAAKEKHVPVITKTADGYKVVVGSTLHPMEEKHWIEWIELMVDDEVYTRLLKPGGKPEASFCICGKKPKTLRAREYCNLHGLWTASK